MPKNDSNPLGQENNSALKVRQIQQENYYKTAIVSEAAYQKKKFDLESQYLVKQLESQIQAENEILAKKLKDSRLSEDTKLEYMRKNAETIASIEKQIASAKEKADKEAFEYATKLSDKIYESKTIKQRQQIQQELADSLRIQKRKQQDHILELQALKDIQEAKLKDGTDEEKVKAQEELNKLSLDLKNTTKDLSKTSAEEVAAKKESARLSKIVSDADDQRLTAAQKLAKKEKEIQDIKERAESDKENAQDDLAYYEAQKKQGNLTDKESEELNKKIQELNDIIKRANETIDSSSSDLAQGLDDLRNQVADEEFSKKLDEITSQSSKSGADKFHKDTKLDLAQRSANAQSKIAYKNSDEYKEDKQEEKRVKYEEALAERGSFSDALGKNLEKGLENVAGAVSAAMSDALNKIDGYVDSFFEYQAQIDARLNGADETYKDALKTIRTNVGISTIVSQKDMIANVKKLVESGVAFDLDQRAFLATISDRIAQTFDVFDSNLMRIIRLQQADTTAARLGMEASLNELFNQYFSDTSYLSDAFDSVSQAIIDANAQLTRNASLEFEYIVQKWLGSLYSLGLSQNTVSTIAQGLNYLGTGNVEALSSNESLQSLLAMSSSRAGISYADILTGGLDAETTNKLLKSMVLYLKDIAENSSNQVTKNAYANIFGMNTTDLIAVSNLQQSEIESLYKQTLNYTSAIQELDTQMSQISSRTHISQKISTTIDNLMAEAASGIGSNGILYGTWKVLNIIEDLTGGIAIPAISVFGNMVDLHTTVTQLAKAGVAGFSLMGSLIGGLGKSRDALSSSTWNFDQYTSRGGELKRISKGTASGFSQSAEMSMVGSGSGQDMKNTTLSDGASSAEEDSKITNASVEGNSDIYQKIYEAVADDSTSVLMEIVSIHDLLNEDRLFKAQISGMDELKDLLDPTRVFYSSLVGIMPLKGSSFSLSSKSNLLTLSLTDVSSYVENLSGVSLVESFWKSMNTPIVESVNNVSKTAMSLATNFSTSQAVNSIQNSEGSPISQNSTSVTNSEQRITAESSGTSGITLSSFGPSAKSTIESIIKNSLKEALNSTAENGNEDPDSFIALLRTLLSNLDVTVTNNGFEEMLQKLAYRN